MNIPRPDQITTQFSRVAAINRLAGNYITPRYDTVRHQAEHIIKPEARELIAGIAANDAWEIRDGVADVMFTLAGMYARLGLRDPSSDIIEAVVARPITLETATEMAASLPALCDAMCAIAKADFRANLGAVTTILNMVLARTSAIGAHFGYPLMEDLDAVIESNMSKFDTLEGDADATVAKYAKLGVAVQAVLTRTTAGDAYFVCRVISDSVGTDGKTYPTGKWVKSVNFKEPVYRPL